MNTEIINTIVKAIITIVVCVITGFVIPWLKNKIGEQKFAQIEEFTTIAVRTAEMIFETEQFKEKKEFAVDYVEQKARELGITLSLDDIDSLVESTVNDIKYIYTNKKE